MTFRFSDSEHIYSIVEKPDVKLTSVSGVLHRFIPKFDRQTISKKYAEKRGLEQQDVLDAWDAKNKKSLTRGSLFHAEEEKRCLDAGAKPGYITIDNDIKEALDLTSLKPGIYTELIIPYLPFKLIGTADKIQIFEDKTFTITDYKTNEKLEFEATAYFKPELKRKVKEMMLSPLSHLDNCNGIHYLLQLSMYAYFLEAQGYKFKSGIIEHIIFEDDVPVNRIQYPLSYLKSEVLLILKALKQYG